MSEKYNDCITSEYNTLPCKTKKQQDFINKALSINREGRPFSYSDFPEYSPTNFRQMIYKLKGRFELVFRSSCGFYKIKGIELSRDKHRTVSQPMGVHDDMQSMLQSISEKLEEIHDLKFKFSSDNLHQILKSLGHVEDPSNCLIKLEIPLDKYVTAKILVYPKTVQVNLSCTFKPIIYDAEGVVKLTTFLGRICQYLIDISSGTANIPSSQEWIVTHYHLGKDGTCEIAGSRFEIKWEGIAGDLIRFYSKKMPDGKIIPRIEQIKIPRTTVKEEIQYMIKHNSPQK